MIHTVADLIEALRAYDPSEQIALTAGIRRYEIGQVAKVDGSVHVVGGEYIGGFFAEAINDQEEHRAP